MDIFKDTITTKYIDENTIVLDIETTGVDRINCFIQVVGLLSGSGENNFSQISITSIEDEPSLLRYIAKSIHKKSIITFNGINFDLPFIYARMNFHGIDLPSIISHTDIYRFLIDNRFYTTLNEFSLQSLEQHLSIERFENFEKEEDIAFYKEEKTQPNLLLHNKYDVINTEKALAFIEDINNQKVFKLELSEKTLSFTISDIELNKDILKVYLQSENKDNLRFESLHHVFDWTGTKIQIFARVQEGYLSKDVLGYVHMQSSLPLIKDQSPYYLREDILVIYHNRYLELENIKELSKKIIKEFLK